MSLLTYVPAHLPPHIDAHIRDAIKTACEEIVAEEIKKAQVLIDRRVREAVVNLSATIVRSCDLEIGADKITIIFKIPGPPKP